MASLFSPTAIVVATPIATSSALDAFWVSFLSYSCVGFPPVIDDWKTVAELTANSDVVVLGEPRAIEHRRDPQYGENVTVMIFYVDQVLHGDVRSRREGDIEVVAYWKVDPPVDTVVGIPQILFLTSMANEELAAGHAVSDDDKYSYFTDAPFQNVVANVNGKVVIPLFDRYGDEWSQYYTLPSELEGMPFDKLVCEIVDAPTGASYLRSGFAQHGYFAC